MSIPPPISFTGISKFSDNFQSILERAFLVANLPIQNLQTEQTLSISRQTELANLATDVRSLRDVFSSLGILSAQGGITVSSSDASVALAVQTGAPGQVAIDLDVTSAATAAQETGLTGFADIGTTAPEADGIYSLTVGATTTNIDLLTIGSGRAAGAAGSTAPSPKVSVDVAFSGGLSGSISAELESFFVGAAAVSGAGGGDTVEVVFTSTDGSISETVSTAALSGGESAADLATALNTAIGLNANLSGKVSFSDESGSLKLVVADTAGIGFDFTSTSTGTVVSGLEGGGTAGGHSAEEIAAALNAQVLADATLSAAGVLFSAVGGEVQVNGDQGFDITVTDNAQATGFASGLAGAHSVAGFDNTLDGLSRFINAADLGVAATIVNTSSDPDNPDFRLTLAAAETGATILELKDSGLNDLLTAVNQGSNAVFSINGVQSTNSGNTIEDFVPGVRLTIVDAGQTTIQAAPDQSGVSSALANFVAQYNQLFARLQSHVGEGAGILSGSQLVRETQATLRRITSFDGSGDVGSIAELGLTLAQDGELSFDAAQFSSLASANFTGVLEFLGDTTTGFAGLAFGQLSSLSDPVTGQIQSAIDFLQESDEGLQTQIDTLRERIDLQIKNLEERFAAADVLLGRLEAQQDLLTRLFDFQNNFNN